jgi:hypothetical protein
MISCLNVSAVSSSGPKRTSSTPEKQTRLIGQGFGSAGIGMPAAQARRALRPLTLRSTRDQQAVALIGIMRGLETVMTLYDPLTRVVSIPITGAANQAGANSLCATAERVVFSAFVEGSGKLASICSSRRLDARKGYLQYRFGRPGNVELQFPSSRRNTQKAFTYTGYTRPLVTYLTLTFTTSDYRYSIGVDYNAELKPASHDAYITVTTLGAPGADSKDVTIKLRTPVTGSLMTLEDVVPNEPWTKER